MPEHAVATQKNYEQSAVRTGSWWQNKTVLLGSIIVAVIAGGFTFFFWNELLVTTGYSAAPKPTVNSKRAYGYLKTICKIGPRPSGTRGMAAQQQLLAKHFQKLGGKVFIQQFQFADPRSGRPVRCKNLIVSWHPKSKERVLIGCHYDTRPFPDRDRRNPRGRFVGANDGGSGVALLMELAHHMKNVKSKYGVDFIFFDAEEYIPVVPPQFGKGFDHLKYYFMGSTYFAKSYRDRPPKHRYLGGIIVDMVGDKNLKIYKDRNSFRYAPDVTRSVWKAAAKLGERSFVNKEIPANLPGGISGVQDDHIPLNRIAKIPTCDIIDFDYPHWHTTQDVPANCSGESLAIVGRVVLKWLENPLKP